MDRITEEWGPIQQDPFGFRGDPTAIFETLEWKRSRTLLVPPPRRLGATIELLKKIASKPPHDPPSAWEAMAVLITPLWVGAQWWPSLVEMRTAYLDLGRIPSKGFTRWKERNGH